MGTITTTDGTEIFYKDWGSGQPIVFSHGWPLSADDWDTQMLFFLQHGYRVIAHDRRGHGRSTQTGDGHDMDHYADDLAALDRASRPPRRRPRRPLHRWRRGRALHRPPRREPGGQGGADQLGAAAHGPDRRQPRRAAQERVRRPPGPARRQPLRVLPGPAVRPVLRVQPARASKPSEAIIENWWRQGMMGGAKAHYDGIVAFSQTDFTEDLKKITVPGAGDARRRRPDRPLRRLRAAVGRARPERDAQDLRRVPPRHADHPGRDDQRRPARLHPVLTPSMPATSGPSQPQKRCA